MTLLSASRRSRARYAAILLVLPVLAGCSVAAHGSPASGAASKPSTSASASSGPAASADRNPCDYLSAADASTVYGVALTSTELGGACDYSGAGATGFATTVTGGLKGADDPDWKNEVSSLSSATKVSGVGDEAYGSVGGFEVKLIVRAHNTIIEIADADDSSSTTFPKSIAIANAIISKLG